MGLAFLRGIVPEILINAPAEKLSKQGLKRYLGFAHLFAWVGRSEVYAHPVVSTSTRVFVFSSASLSSWERNAIATALR